MAEATPNAAATGLSGGQGRPVQASSEGRVSALNVLKFAGAFVAFLIGSGYASGQEIMQFFTAYGIWSIGGLLIALVLFAWLGKVLMNYGHRHRDLGPDHMADQGFRYYCGKYFGAFLAWFIPVFLLLVCIVMTSGAGATLAQYFGLPNWVGSAGMCAIVLVTNFFGFKRIVDVIGVVGPLIIVFSVVIAAVAIATNPGGLMEIGEHAATFEGMANATNGAPLWALAGLLYVAYNVAGALPFFTQTGGTACSAREAKWGGVIGGIAFIGAAILMNTGLLCHIEDVAQLEVPTLFLSDLISPVVSVVFAVILMGGIYSTAAPMMWTSVNRFAPEGTKRNKIVLVAFSVIIMLVVLSPLSYGQLMGIVYPYTGYIGIVFIVCVIVRQIIEAYNKKKGLDVETPLIFKKDEA
ncbi:MAG: hypothetical protein Q4D92_02190 [Slackia sp.]|nr:hypothetical protein [Slackia sp.]